MFPYYVVTGKYCCPRLYGNTPALDAKFVPKSIESLNQDKLKRITSRYKMDEKINAEFTDTEQPIIMFEEFNNRITDRFMSLKKEMDKNPGAYSLSYDPKEGYRLSVQMVFYTPGNSTPTALPSRIPWMSRALVWILSFLAGLTACWVFDMIYTRR